MSAELDRLRAVTHAQHAELIELRAAVARVRAVHPEKFMGVGDTWPVCGHCRDSDEEPTPYPCSTVAALDGPGRS